MHIDIDGFYIIEILNSKTFLSYVLFKQKLHQNTRIRNLNWIDQNSFLYDLDFGNISSTHVIHLEFDQAGVLTGASQFEFPIEGVVIDTLDDVPNTLLFANFTEQESVRNDGRGLYRVDTSNKETLKKSFWKIMSHTKQFDHVVQWMTDKHGFVRSAIEVEIDKKQEMVIYHHWFLDKSTGDDEWKQINSFTTDQEVPLPVMLSDDEKFFYTLTNQFGEMKSIHKYSTKDYSYLGPFYEDEKHDITAINLDPSTKEIVAYSYIESGELKLNYFDDADDRIKSLKEKNPGISLFVRQYDKKTGNMLVYGYTSFSKGTWYLYNEHTEAISKLIDVNEAYENLPKGDNHVINISADDGVAIEGYLVTPSAESQKQFPLVVMPHGGPIGVRDYADNDELQHFFAAHGIASLKINYRGSGGFGKSFESLGNGQWGEQIEADIHKMVNHVVKKYDLNGEKICAMGGSYGGYSALMLTILYPDTYQCAVSFAGVVDLPLMFTGISASAYDEYHDVMKKIVGDPKKDLQQMIEKSPFYLVEKINKPIKLFHGQLDDTVSLEQSLRMVQAMSLLNKEVDFTIFEDEAHSSKFVNTDVIYYAESLKFIQNKLGLHSTAQDYVSPDEVDSETSVLDYIQGNKDQN
ncbi:MAG: alpha/beta hydrolase family protein [Marinicella sp.]